MPQKHYLPLESNPDVFTRLIRNLGVSSLSFHDVLSLTEPELLDWIPRPVLALVLVLPTTKKYEEDVALEEAKRNVYTGHGDNEDVVWFRQTIGNACGLYAILHALCNGEATQSIQNDSLLSQLLTTCIPLPPQERAEALEASAELEAAHAAAAYEGDSAVPASAEDPVDYHYVCLVKSHKNGRLYEMNGDLKGPVDRGPIDGDLLSKGAVDVLNTFIQREEGEFGFSLVALAKNPDS